MTIFTEKSKETVAAKAEISSIPEITEDFARHRDCYEVKFGKKSSLSNDQLLTMIARSDDDMGQEDWVNFMKAIEDGTSDKFAETYNASLAA